MSSSADPAQKDRGEQKEFTRGRIHYFGRPADRQADNMHLRSNLVPAERCSCCELVVTDACDKPGVGFRIPFPTAPVVGAGTEQLPEEQQQTCKITQASRP